MWGEFAVAALMMTSVLVLPGFILLRALGCNNIWAIICSPIVSISLITIFGQILALLNITATPFLLPLLATLFPVLIFLFFRRSGLDLNLPNIRPWMPIVYVLLGVALGYNLFLSRLETLDALFQAYDVTQHLNLIQAMADSGTFSSLGTNPYLSAADQAIDPLKNGGFYPAAWHTLCAIIVNITGYSVPLVINVSMFIFSCLVFPLATLALIAVIFKDSWKLQLCGSLIGLGFVSYPWNLLTFGPVYANLAGFALMPIAMALFIHMLADGLHATQRLRVLSLLLISTVGLTLCHPNTVFTCVVFLSPYCVSRICDACNSLDKGAVHKIILSAAFVALCLCFWVICYNLPAFKDTVSHIWPPFTRAFQGIINVLSLSYNMGFNYETAAQLLLGSLVIIGIIRALYLPGKRWLVASYLLICYILLISATHSDEYKQFVAGFWYTDPMRLSAIAAIAAIPLAALGTYWTYQTIVRVVKNYNKEFETPANQKTIAIVCSCLFLAINFIPEFNFPGLHHEYSADEQVQYKKLEVRDWPKSVHTTFGDYRKAVEDTYAYSQPLDNAEKQFLEKVAETIPDGALIINNPMDGSFLAYGVNGLRVYNRNFVGYGGDNETEESRVVRKRLCDYATDAEVERAVEKLDAKYVLILQGKEAESGFINLRGDYDENEFDGISSISDSTPGFKLIQRSGNLKLYEIIR